MAAAWRAVWRRTIASTNRGGGDPVQLQPPPQPALLDHSYDDNCGASSIASGTILSVSNTATTYATSTAASLPFPFTAAAAGGTDEEKAMLREHIRDLIVHGSNGGCGAATSSSSSALGRCLSELQVSWVLHLAQLDAASAGRTFVSRRFQHTARSWVIALHAIGRSVASFAGWCSSQDQQQEEEALPWPPASEFVGFFAATFLLMLPFVDAVVALDDVISPASASISNGMVSGNNKGAVASAHKFRTLVDVRDALSGVSEQVQLWHSFLSSSCSSSTDAEAARISAEMIRLLLAKLDKVDEAMRNTRDCIRTHFMSLTADDHGHDYTAASGLDPSPGTHVATHFAVSYIIVLSTSYSDNRSSLELDPPTAYEEASLSLGEKNASSSTNLNTVIIRSLEESLTRVSQSFPDQSLRFLFLANNFYFLWHQLLHKNMHLEVPTDALACKIHGYINSYLQVSWTPVLKPLHNRTPCCFFFFTRYSAQRRFLAELEKTYITQKLWKVPDPELRKVLRIAIVDKVISAFTRFLEDGGVSASRVVISPDSLREMLEELFEG